MRLKSDILLLSYISLATVSASIVTPALPNIEHDLLLQHGAIEWIISIFLLGYVVGQLIYGPIGNRVGAKPALIIGTKVNVTGCIVCLIGACSSSYIFILAGRFISALGGAAGLSCTITIITQNYSKQKAKSLLAYVGVSFTIGLGVAITIGGFVTEYFGWQSVFVVLSFYSILMLYMTRYLANPTTDIISHKNNSVIVTYISVLKDKNIVIYALILGMVSTVSYGYNAIGPIFAQYNLSLTPLEFGVWNILPMVGMLLSSFVSRAMLSKFTPNTMIIVGTTGCFLGSLLMYYSYIFGNINAIWFFGIIFFMYIFNGIIYPAASFVAMSSATNKAGASSMMSFINIGFAMLMIILIGYTASETILSYLYILMTNSIVILCIIIETRLKNKKI